MKLYLTLILLGLVCLGAGYARTESGGSIYFVSVNAVEIPGAGSLDAGDSGRIEIVLGNSLGYEARAVRGILSTNQSGVSIIDDNAWWPNIENGSWKSSRPNHMEVELSEDNEESVLYLTLLVSWMDPVGEWLNTTVHLSTPINREYDVIPTSNNQEQYLQPIIRVVKTNYQFTYPRTHHVEAIAMNFGDLTAFNVTIRATFWKFTPDEKAMEPFATNIVVCVLHDVPGRGYRKISQTLSFPGGGADYWEIQALPVNEADGLMLVVMIGIIGITASSSLPKLIHPTNDNRH